MEYVTTNDYLCESILGNASISNIIYNIGAVGALETYNMLETRNVPMNSSGPRYGDMPPLLLQAGNVFHPTSVGWKKPSMLVLSLHYTSILTRATHGLLS